MSLNPVHVSRFLGKKFTRSEYQASAAIRGWGTNTAGFKVRTYLLGKAVRVDFIPGDVARYQDLDEKRRRADEALTLYAEHLKTKYEVQRKPSPSSDPRFAFLVITEKESK